MSEKQYTEKQLAFLEALPRCGGDISLAIKEAGYSENIRPSVIIKSLKDEIIEIAKDMLASSSVKAAIAMDNVLYDPSQIGANNKMTAAKEILDRVGIVKTEKVDVSSSDGIVILPAKVRDSDDSGMDA